MRLLRSSVLVWPNLERIEHALKLWAEGEARRRPQLMGLGYFGSYARGDWGVGGDVDVVIVLGDSDLPPEKRLLGWDSKDLPIPADLFIYTLDEWEALSARSGRFTRTLQKELKWMYRRGDFGGFPEESNQSRNR